MFNFARSSFLLFSFSYEDIPLRFSPLSLFSLPLFPHAFSLSFFMWTKHKPISDMALPSEISLIAKTFPLHYFFLFLTCFLSSLLLLSISSLFSFLGILTHFATRMLNGLGGSADFLRNAKLSIMHTPSVRPSKNDPLGITSVVPMCSHVDQTEHDLDVFVTEQGLADVRGMIRVLA